MFHLNKLFILYLIFSQFAMASTEEVIKQNFSQYNSDCETVSDAYVFSFSHSYKENILEHLKEKTITYFVLSCPSGVTNRSAVLLKFNDENALVSVPFSEPILNSKNQIIGWSSTEIVYGLSYNAQSKELSTYFKENAAGDTSKSGIYLLYQDKVMLRKYLVDNTKDRKENPIVIYESKYPIGD